MRAPSRIVTVAFGSLLSADRGDRRDLVEADPDVEQNDDDERREIEQHDDPWIGEAVGERASPHEVAERRPERHRQRESRRNARHRDRHRREQLARRRRLAHRGEDRGGPGRYRGSLKCAADAPERDQRDERQKPQGHVGSLRLRGVEEQRNVEVRRVADEILAAACDDRPIERLGVLRLLGDRALRNAFEIALAVGFESGVVGEMQRGS